MSRYRKVSPRFWKDEKVSTLTPVEKLIALYLFTSPQSNRIGLFSFSPGEACEDLGISMETFAEGWAKPFGNVCRTLNLAFDEGARVLFLPTWWKYNTPENPNVLKACLADLQEVPQTPLSKRFSENLEHLPETFHQTFREGLGKPSPKPSPKQEQEQKQKQDNKPKRKERRKTDALFLDGFSQFYEVYPRHESPAKAEIAWSNIHPDPDLQSQIIDAARRYRDVCEARRTERKHIKMPATWLNGKCWLDEYETTMRPIKAEPSLMPELGA